MSPDPSDVGTSEMYGSSGPTATDRVAGTVGRVIDGVRSPDDAEGWVGILLPAIVTGIAIEAVRRAI